MNKMPTERWRLIDTILEAALERPPDERSAFVRDADGVDAGMLQDLEGLLNVHSQAESLLGESVASYAAPLMPDLVDHIETEQKGGIAPGTRIGPYEILHEIGRGGMGSVYLAKRADSAFEKKVALKLVRRGLDTYDVLQRFRYERQILASLEHPNVAGLYDGGVSQDGRPYFVMEYVEGEAIDVYCNRHKLSVRDRLELFLTVCKVVSYAHQNLIVHRDLKPSNILVTSDGTVKLLDFGIAKLLDHTSQKSTIPNTQTGMRLLSLRYAAPEQLLGTGLTTASDVFALGVILFELLTGQAPFDRRRSFTAEAVLNEDPPLPSRSILQRRNTRDPERSAQTITPEQISDERGTTVERLQRALKGDLDTILLTALRKEPERRYRTTDRLIEDLNRHLNGLPVSARPDTMRYRLQKFVARHRAGVAAGLMATLLLMFFAGAMTVQHAQTTKERDNAVQARDKAGELATFLQGLFEASNPFQVSMERTDTLRARDLLDRGAERARDELSARPLVQAQMFQSIGRAYQGLGLYAEARGHLEAALELRRDVLGPAHDEIAGSLTDLGYLLYLQGGYSESESYLREAVNYHTSLQREPSEDMADAFFSLAGTLSARGAYAEAEQLHREALEARRLRHGPVHADVAASLSMLASVLVTVRNYEEAEDLFRESLSVRRQVYGTGHPGYAVGLNNLASMLRDIREYDEAEELIREALRINQEILGADHPHVADNMTLLASVLRNKGDYDAAEPILRESVEITRHLYGDHHPTLSITLDTYAALLGALERYDEAESAQREAVAIARNAFGDTHYAVGLTTSKLAGVMLKKGQLSEAMIFYREAESIMKEIFPASHPTVITIQQHLASVLIDSGDYIEAERTLLNSYDALDRTEGVQNRLERSILDKLVRLYETWGDAENEMRYRALMVD